MSSDRAVEIPLKVAGILPKTMSIFLLIFFNVLGTYLKKTKIINYFSRLHTTLAKNNQKFNMY